MMTKEKKIGEQVKNAWSFIAIGKKELSSDEAKIMEINNAVKFGTLEEQKGVLYSIRLLIPPEEMSNQSPALLEAIERLKASINSQTPTADTQTKERHIDIERLKAHFNLSFKRKDGGFDTLVNIIRQDKSPKDYAKLALQIFNCKYFLKADFAKKNGRGFAHWLRTFYDIIDCNPVEYRPRDLKLTLQEEAPYGFLNA